MTKPKILYKYRDVGKYTEKIFIDKTIWLSKPENLNDPFECSIAKFTEKAKEAKIRRYRQLQIQGFLIGGAISLSRNEEYYSLWGKDLESFLKMVAAEPSWERQYKLIDDLVYQITKGHFSNPNQIIESLQNRLENTGIFSLSETATNQLMWAHYANESHGLALGFEVEEGSKLADDRYCLPINYSDELPEFGEKDPIITTQYFNDENGFRAQSCVSFDDPTFRMCVSTKPTDWAYEKEWRYIDETYGLHSFPGKLVEVVFGLRCTEENRQLYVNLAKDNFDYPIRFYEIIKKPDSNQIAKIEYNI